MSDYLADGIPIDEDEFTRRACDPHSSVVVEACAGSGKTWLLVSRIVRLLLAGTPPGEILAITFTRRAGAGNAGAPAARPQGARERHRRQGRREPRVSADCRARRRLPPSMMRAIFTSVSSPRGCH